MNNNNNINNNSNNKARKRPSFIRQSKPPMRKGVNDARSDPFCSPENEMWGKGRKYTQGKERKGKKMKIT